MDDGKDGKKNEMEEKEEEVGGVDLPELQPLQRDEDLKERVLKQLVSVCLQYLSMVDLLSNFLLPQAELTKSMIAISLLSPGCW